MRSLTFRMIRSGLCLVFVAVLPLVSHAEPRTTTPADHPPLARPQQTTNLLSNPGFENGLASWSACGGARLVDAQAPGVTRAMVHSGRYAVRLGNPTNSNDCPPPASPYSDRMDQALLQVITVPPEAPAVTVSFWYSITGNAPTEVHVMLTKDLYDYTFDPRGAYLDRLLYGDQPGWHLFRQVLTAAELAEVKQQGSLNLQFTIEDPLGQNDNSAFYIDDLQVIPAAVTTSASPLPNELRGNRGQPIVYVRDDPNNPSYNNAIYRMDTDGSNARRIFTGFLQDSSQPTWSPDGGRIALIDENVYPPNEPDPEKRVPATALVLIDPNGGTPRTIYQTTGQSGEPDLISQLTDLTWSPDGSTLAGSIFDYLRYNDGRLGGGIATVWQIDAATGQGRQILNAATAPNWGRTNRLLFEAYELYGDSRRDYSIWELDLNTNPPTERSLIPEPKLRYSTDNDFDPVWAPDGQRFVTIRTISGNFYDADGDKHYNHAMMLFNRQDLDNPQLILLGDHGFISEPTWSPDGKYILYTLTRDDRRDIWWLDVATGATGPVTNDGLSHSAHWRPTGSAIIFLPLVRR